MQINVEMEIKSNSLNFNYEFDPARDKRNQKSESIYQNILYDCFIVLIITIIANYFSPLEHRTNVGDQNTPKMIWILSTVCN